jgi:hypothetical protein
MGIAFSFSNPLIIAAARCVATYTEIIEAFEAWVADLAFQVPGPILFDVCHAGIKIHERLIFNENLDSPGNPS